MIMMTMAKMMMIMMMMTMVKMMMIMMMMAKAIVKITLTASQVISNGTQLHRTPATFASNQKVKMIKR